MFVRHLMGSTSLSTGPQWQSSDLGQYAPGQGRLTGTAGSGMLVQWELDRSAGRLFRTTLNESANVAVDPIQQVGAVGPNGLVPVLRTLKGQPGFYLYRTDKTGLVGDPVSSGPVRSVSGYTPWLLGQAGSAFLKQTQSGPISATITTSDIVYVDQSSGAQFHVGTVIGSANQPSVIFGFYVGADLVALAGNYLGYQSPTAATWANVLQASGSRARRATIPQSIWQDSNTFLRMRAASTPEGISFAAWRRPLTSSTRVRAMSIGFQNNGSVNRTFLRRGASYSPVTVGVHEIEIGPATGSGSGVTYHTMAYHASTYTGVLIIEGNATRFITTGQSSIDDTVQLSQYVNGDGSPSGEFIVTSAGQWNYVPPQSSQPLVSAFLVTINNILTKGRQAGTFDVLDLNGTYVKTSAYPPGTTGTANNMGMYLLQSPDALVTAMQTYQAPGYISLDLGATWQSIQAWGPRGSTYTGGSQNAADLPSTIELGTIGRLFYT